MGRNSQCDGWARAGYLQVTEGEVIDFDLIEDAVRADVRALQVEEVPYDPWQATQLASHLLAEGAPMVEYRQTVQNMSEPMKMLEALVLQRKLTHNANPMMTWMISNVVCHRDAKDNIYPRKEREENKIDGPVAAIMALGRFVATRETMPVLGADFELLVV
jgi:phage terminase large subunit-like protein